MSPTHRNRPLLFLLVSTSTVVATACSFRINFDEPGPTVTETVEIASFSELEVDSAFRVVFEVADEPTLSVDISENLLADLEVEQSGDRLSLDLSGSHNLSGDHVLEATVTAPDLELLNIDGASRIELVNIELDQLELEIDGASRLTGNGSIDDLRIAADGASRTDLGDVTIGQVYVQAGGASRVSVDRASSVSGELDGAARMEIGSESVLGDLTTSGASSVDRP